MITNWPGPWKSIDDRRKKYIERELRWELSHVADHPLINRSFDVVAMRDQYEHAIIRFDAGDFGYVRLTWKQAPPHDERIGEEPELMRFLKAAGEGEATPFAFTVVQLARKLCEFRWHRHSCL